MSFCGSIGTIMTGSGIDKLFQNIYGENAVKNMLSGEAVARASRAYIIAESALLIKLQQIAWSQSADSTNDVNSEVIQKLWKTFLSKEVGVNLDLPEKQALRAVLESTKIALREKSWTTKLRM